MSTSVEDRVECKTRRVKTVNGRCSKTDVKNRNGLVCWSRAKGLTKVLQGQVLAPRARGRTQTSPPGRGAGRGTPSETNSLPRARPLVLAGLFGNFATQLPVPPFENRQLERHDHRDLQFNRAMRSAETAPPLSSQSPTKHSAPRHRPQPQPAGLLLTPVFCRADVPRAGRHSPPPLPSSGQPGLGTPCALHLREGVRTCEPALAWLP